MCCVRTSRQQYIRPNKIVVSHLGVMHPGTLPNKREHLDYDKLITKWATHPQVRCSLGVDKEEELCYFVLAFVLELAVVQ